MKTIDARGLSCPEPVVLLRTAMVSGEDSYQIIVDNHASRENTTRYAQHMGYEVKEVSSAPYEKKGLFGVFKR